MKIFRPNTLTLALTTLSLSLSAAHAQTTTDSSTVTGYTELQPLIVVATPFSQQMGTQKVTAEQIENYPTRNGTITEFLKYNPNVTFSNSGTTSNNLGEIEPEKVSFHGEKFYNNNFTIDGLSNNNSIDPAGDTTPSAAAGYTATDLPAGGSQTFWITSDLIGSFEAFDSNVSAKYGDFTGGVVDVKIKDPSLNRSSGRISWRTTRDSWVKFYVENPDSFNLANGVAKQPKYTKNFYTLTLNQPITDKFGLLFNYSRQESKIPYWHTNLQKWEDRERLNENYMLKGIYTTDHGDILRGTLIYAPHTSTNVKNNVLNGAFDNSGGGYRANFEWERPTDWGKITTNLAYQYNQNKISHNADQYTTWYSTASFSGITTANTFGIGGHGKYATENKTITAKQDYEFNATNYGKFIESNWLLGWELKNEQAKYKRYRDSYINVQGTRNANTTCNANDEFCIAGEQYITRRQLYPARTVDADITKYSAYVENKLKIGRVEFVPGLRLDYDNYMENINIAPRFSMTVDVLNDGRSKIFGGANRYYKSGVLAYKMREGITGYYLILRTGSTGTWNTANTQTTASTTTNDVSGLKSPYSDELNFGIAQEMFNTLWTFKWVKRDGKNQFARETVRDANGRRYYQMTNNGRTKGESWSLTIHPLDSFKLGNVANLNWSVMAARTKNKSSSSTDYDSTETGNMVIYKGQLIQPEDMDALDFNTPWKVSALATLTFPKINLRWTHDLTYTAGHDSYTSSNGTCPAYNSDICGSYVGAVTEYTKAKYGSAITYDWRLDYKQPTFKKQSLEIGLDIINIFNRKITATTTSNTITYKPGREFWLTVAYNF